MSHHDSSPNSQSASGTPTATAFAKHSAGCTCPDSRLIAQQQAVRQPPEMVLRRAALTKKTDPGYMDLETVAEVLHSWHKAELTKLVDTLWQILEKRTKSKICSMIQTLTYSSRTNLDQKMDIVSDVRLAMYKGIISGTYLWKCHFYYALNMRIKTAITMHLAKSHVTTTTQVDDFDVLAAVIPGNQARLDYALVETRNRLDNVYLSKLDDDQRLMVGLLHDGYTYEEIGRLMHVTLHECNAMVKQLRERIKRIEKTENNEESR